MKCLYLISLIVALFKAQEHSKGCDSYRQYNIDYYGKLISHLRLSNTSDIILANNRLLIIDNELSVLSSLPIPKINSSLCEWIFNQSPGLIFVGCQSNGEAPYLIAYKIINNTHLTQFGDIVYFPLNETVNDIKGTLNTLFTIQSEKLTFFKLIMTLTDWTIQTTQYVLDRDYFDFWMYNELQIMDLEFETYWLDNIQYYKLIIVEYQSGAYWVDTIVENNILSPIRFGQIYLKCCNLKATIHSTTQNESFITFTKGNGGYPFYINIKYEIITWILLEFDSPTFDWIASSKLKQIGNVQGIMYRNSKNKQSVLWLYNVVLPQPQNQIESLQTDQQNQTQALKAYPRIDTLTSPPQDYSIFYFSSEFTVVHSIEDNKLQSCDLYNYKIQME
ncbi:unnamed protein product [Paramecium sonneborni]|uniref:Transmembrane protein n=1 Tax=Paramecium sonneborni TaxID=65129 RepID=A0A8S1QZH7_9CILI|nr:unnamed protein product [Paramecium sonneborni]